MKQLKYDEALKELETILATLQADLVSVEDLKAKSARAKELLDFCQRRLREVEAAIATE